MTVLKSRIQVWKNPGKIIRTPVFTGIDNDGDLNPKINQANNGLNDNKI